MGPASYEFRTARALLLSRAAAASCCALLLLAGCVTKITDLPKEGPIDAKPVVIPAAPGVVRADPESPEKRAAAEAALALAENAWRSGDALSALAICNQAARDGLPADLAERFQALRAKARNSIVASRVVRLHAIPKKDAVAAGEDVPLIIRIENLTGVPISIPKKEGGSSIALFVLKIAREDYDVFGNRRASEFTVRAPLEEDVEIPAGGSREAHVVIGKDLMRIEHQGFTVLRVEGQLRPIAIRVGDSEFFDALPIDVATVRIFLAGWEPLAADPVASLRKAIAKRSPPHILTASELLAATERAAGRTILRDAAAADPPLAAVCAAAAARLDELDATPPPPPAR